MSLSFERKIFKSPEAKLVLFTLISSKMFVGTCLMFCSVLCFTTYSVLIQWFHLYPSDLILGRGMWQVIVFGFFLILKGEFPQINKETLGLGFLSYWCVVGFIFVIHVLPLGIGVILTRSSPPFAAVFAWILMKEPFKAAHCICIVTLAIGQLLVLQPSFIFRGGPSVPPEGNNWNLVTFGPFQEP